MKIADIHAHIFPDKLAEKASHSIGDFYGVSIEREANMHCLTAEDRLAGVTRCVVSNSATSAKQVFNANTFLAEAVRGHAGYLAFGTIYPGMDGYEEELDRMLELGLRGIKIHPDFQKLAIDDEISPRMDLEKDPAMISGIMFSNNHVKSMDTTREPEVLLPKEEDPRVKQISTKSRYAFDEKGAALPKMKVYNIRDGLFEAIIDKFYEDPTTIAYGEDNRDWGGAFAVYRGLTEALPYHRFFNAPISEAAIVGSSVGYAMAGGRAIVELMYADFIGCAGDEIFNQLSKWQSMSAGILKMPVVVRVSVGSKYGAQHSQDWTALCAHIPGLKVCFPATPYDAKGLMAAALNGTDPVIFFESQRIYDKGEEFHAGGVPAESYEVPFGEPDVKREGKDVTILTIGAVLYRAMEAADKLQKEYGISAEIIDARSIVPFNYEKVLESVKKTGKLVVVGDACDRGSIMKEIAENVSEMAFDYLDPPAVVVGARNWITPAYELDNYFFPQASWIIDAIHEKIMPIPGYVATTNFTTQEKIRNNKKGV